MAIQNFLSGGFYGKLGDVVGQRWHNKRTVRSYVIPINPRTELQQNNRALFATATSLAQEAYKSNRGSELWDTTSVGQFSQMVGIAKRRLQNGATPEQALPLYPDSFQPDVIISDINISWANWATSVSFTSNAFIFSQPRELDFIIKALNVFSGNWEFITDSVSFPSGSVLSYTFNQAGTYALPEGSSIQALSTDDTSFNNSSIQIPAFSFIQPSRPTVSVVLDFPPIDSTTYPGFLYLDFEVPIKKFYSEGYIDLYVWDLSINAWYTVNHFFIIENGFFHMDFEDNNEYTFPPGSHIPAGSYLDNELDDVFIHYSWARLDFSRD